MVAPIKPTASREPDELAFQIGKEINRARVLKKLSVSEVHRQTGISRTVLQGYEAGRYKPGAREMRLLSQALDISPTKLLFGRESFREPDPVELLLGSPDKAQNTAKLAVIFSLLSREEQRALLAMVSLLAEARIGGRAKLAQVLQVADNIVNVAPEILSTVEAAMTPEMLKQIEAKVTAKVPGLAAAASPPAKRRS